MKLMQWIARQFGELAMTDLVNHRVDDRDMEWFAWCKLKQTEHFPFLTYDAVKLATALLVYRTFAPIWALIAIAISAGLVIVVQYWLNRRIASGAYSHLLNFRAFCNIVMARAAVWSSIYAYVILTAPQALMLFLVPAAMLVMFIDGMCMIAMPRRAVLAVGMHSLAIIIPLIMLGTASGALAAVMIGGAFIFLHYIVFTMHHMFATRRLRTRKLEEANDTIQLLLNQYDEDGSDWLFESDQEGKIIRPNHRFCKAANRSAEELNGLRLSLLFKDSAQREELRAIGEREEPFRRLVLPLEIAGVERWWSISARPVYNRDGALLCWRGFIADVTRTHQAEAKVTYMAHYDVLTNLPNRALFNTTLRRAFERRQEDDILAVLYVDLDHFKAVNDTYGHAQGDEVLVEAGRRIERAAGNNAIVARFGGDEFAVLLDRIGDRNVALQAAQAIVSAMDEPIDLQDRRLSIGTSVGIAFAPDNGLNGDDVLRAADLALYDAKSRGRGGASLFDPAMQEEVQERRTLELDLRMALVRGELHVYYQPLLSAEGLKIVGYEALLRWRHPERGLVNPEIFVPIAEETGQIIPIGAWVLREALNEASNWPDDLFISVNLSPGQMGGEGLMNTVIGALANSGVAPHRLELEITETLLMQDNDENMAILHKFRDLGIQIALDDFGTGYSSLNYLRSFPFDKIKIDRCFVSDVARRTDCDAIIQAVVGLAGKLNMITTAEGVENSEQLGKLQTTGCTQVQGFLFSEALPASELTHGTHERADKVQGGNIAALCADEQAGLADEKTQQKTG